MLSKLLRKKNLEQMIDFASKEKGLKKGFF